MPISGLALFAAPALRDREVEPGVTPARMIRSALDLPISLGDCHLAEGTAARAERPRGMP
jgi:hypothetical protein